MARRLLAKAWDEPTLVVSVLSDHSTRASGVVRLAVAGSDTTVFAKRPVDPSSAARERAALEFLNDIDSPIPLSPALYAADVESGAMVLEDLGDGEGPNTGDLLMGSDPELALVALLEHARLLATLHGLTLGRWEAYREKRGPTIRAAAFEEPWPDHSGEPVPEDELAARARDYRRVLESVGVRAGAGYADEIVALGRATEGVPTPRWALCKGDQNMAGDYVRFKGLPRLMDFGAGGFRPALSEGMPERMTWGCTMAFPRDVADQIASAYQAELAIHAPDLPHSPYARSEAAARWNVFHTLVRLPRALEGDFQRGPTRMRQQTIAWLRAFCESEGADAYPALHEGAEGCLERLRSVWDEADFHLPRWPAFANSRLDP